MAAMTNPQADGQRFCCFAEIHWMQEIAQILDRYFSERGYKIATRMLPDFLVRLVGLFDKTVRLVVDDLGVEYKVSNARILQELDWQPRSAEEMVVVTGESLIQHGIV
jgi:nucleoside-diphosphate-sugar epimerase